MWYVITVVASLVVVISVIAGLVVGAESAIVLAADQPDGPPRWRTTG